MFRYFTGLFNLLLSSKNKHVIILLNFFSKKMFQFNLKHLIFLLIYWADLVVYWYHFILCCSIHCCRSLHLPVRYTSSNENTCDPIIYYYVSKVCRLTFGCPDISKLKEPTGAAVATFIVPFGLLIIMFLGGWSYISGTLYCLLSTYKIIMKICNVINIKIKCSMLILII